MIAGVLALATSIVSAQYLNQSAPFSLVLLSDDTTINGSALIACHEGAAIEGLCIGAAVVGAPTTTYTFNYSAAAPVDPAIGVTGLLTYELRGGNFNASSPMELIYNPASNVAVPLLTPSENGQEAAFDNDNKLSIAQYIDDTMAGSPNPYNPKLLYRWYVCTTYEGYTYQTLAWVLGSGAPQNPTCVKVDVLRVFS
jgi:hypothetical protein